MMSCKLLRNLFVFLFRITTTIFFLLLIYGIVVVDDVFAATLLSSSSIERCIRTSANQSYYSSSSSSSSSSTTEQQDPSPTCSSKIVLQLAVDGGTGTSESIIAWRSGVDSDTGRIYTTRDAIRITVKKTPPMIRYPLYYIRNFNSNPTEENIYTSLFGCRDQGNDAQPTCGRAYDINGNPILHSEGFCCECSACSLFGLCDNDDRAYTRCSLFGDAAVANCLSFHELWYSGYSIGPAQTWYEIEITVEYPSSSSSSSSTTTSNTSTTKTVSKKQLTLGPDRLVGTDSPQQQGEETFMSARLHGDFSPFSQPYTLENHVLFVPSWPATNPRVSHGNAAEWMLVPRSDVSVDGRDCNKIGVSYEAFYGQPSRCDVQVHSCLHRQLEKLREEDIERLKNNFAPLYLASGRANFRGYTSSSTSTSTSTSRRKASPLSSRNHSLSSSSSSSCFSIHEKQKQKQGKSSSTFCLNDLIENENLFKFLPYVNNKSKTTRNYNSSSSFQKSKGRKRTANSLSESSSNGVYLAYDVAGVQSSVVTLVLDADKVALTINVASGKIFFVNSTLSSFQANSAQVEVNDIVVIWRNTGDIVAQFFLGISQCSNPNVRVLSKTIEAAPKELQRNVFRLSFVGEAGLFSCNVTLQNSLYDIVDTKKISFNVTETVKDDGAQSGTGNGANGNGVNSSPSPESETCGNCAIWNFVCFLQNSCIWQFSLQSLTSIILLLILLFVVYKLSKYFKCCAGGAENATDDDTEEQLSPKKSERQQRQRKKERKSKKRRTEPLEEKEEDSEFEQEEYNDDEDDEQIQVKVV